LKTMIGGLYCLATTRALELDLVLNFRRLVTIA
jgi:hypothetical protein